MFNIEPSNEGFILLNAGSRERGMQTLEKKEPKRRKGLKFLVTVIFSLVIIASTTLGIAFADQNTAALINEWYNKKVIIAKSIIDEAVQSELTVQKARLEEAIRVKMEEAAKELDLFTQSEAEARRQALEAYADQLISQLNITNEEDEAQIRSKLDEILLSAKGAMTQLAGSYTPPMPVYIAPEGSVTLPVSAAEPVLPTAGESQVSAQPDVKAEEIKPDEANTEKTQPGDVPVKENSAGTGSGQQVPNSAEEKTEPAGTNTTNGDSVSVPESEANTSLNNANGSSTESNLGQSELTSDNTAGENN